MTVPNRIKVGPDTASGPTKPTQVRRNSSSFASCTGVLLPAATCEEAGVAIARHARTWDLGLEPLADEAEPVRLRYAAGILWIRRRRVVVFPGEDADRLSVCRTSGRFTVSSHLTTESSTSTCTRNGDCTDGSRKQ
jgi:hypothetical protein